MKRVQLTNIVALKKCKQTIYYFIMSIIKQPMTLPQFGPTPSADDFSGTFYYFLLPTNYRNNSTDRPKLFIIHRLFYSSGILKS